MLNKILLTFLFLILSVKSHAVGCYTVNGNTFDCNVIIDPVTGNVFSSTNPLPVSGSISVSPSTDSTASGSISALNANLSSGTATASSTVATATLSSTSTANVLVTGTFVQTLLFQISTDGSNWTSLPQITNLATSAIAASVTAVGNYQVSIPASAKFRVTSSAYTSGTATVSIRASSGINTSSLGGSLDSVATSLTSLQGQLPTTLINDRLAVDAITPTSHDSVNLNTAGSVLEGVGKVTITGEAAQMLSVYLDFGGATGATVTVHGSLDGGLTYLPTNLGLQKFGQGSTSTAVTSITSTQSLEINFANYTHIKFTLDAISTGSVVVNWLKSPNNKIVKVPALGDQADTAITDSTQTGSALAFTKGLASLTATSNTSLATIATNSGTQSTAANQATGNTSLATIATQTARFPYLATAGQGTIGVTAAVASPCSSGAGCNVLDAAASGAWTDTRGYGLVVIKVTSTTGTGAYTVETADDSSGVNVMTQTCYYYGVTLSNAVVSFPVTLTNTANYRIFCPINNGYTRVRISTQTGASSSFSLYASNQVPPYVFSQQLSTWTVQPGNTANTTPWLSTITPAVSPISSSSPNEATVSTAYEASHIVKASAGVLYSLLCYNSKASAQFLETFNSTTLPADTTTSVTVPVSCSASSNCTLDFSPYGKYYSTGIVWSNSSTSPTKTIGSADMFCEPRYQ